jgi:hypothetical protein
LQYAIAQGSGGNAIEARDPQPVDQLGEPIVHTRHHPTLGVATVAHSGTLAAFRLGARILRDLRSAYNCTRNHTPEAMRWQSVPTEPSDSYSNGFTFLRGVSTVTPHHDPSLILARFLETTLNAALRAFHPRATITRRDRGPEYGWISGLTVSLYCCCCCLELFNHIAEEATYRRCQNDRCNRLFVRQKGRAEAGQHRREGVKYCSNYCARVAAQRSYRERQRRLRKPE